MVVELEIEPLSPDGDLFKNPFIWQDPAAQRRRTR
jgi:hypothetical protein